VSELGYRNVGDHAEILSGGRVVGVGEETTLTKEELRDPINQELVASGKLIPTDERAEKEAGLANRRQGTIEAKEGEEA
jgi:hypothetical protein